MSRSVNAQRKTFTMSPEPNDGTDFSPWQVPAGAALRGAFRVLPGASLSPCLLRRKSWAILVSINHRSSRTEDRFIAWGLVGRSIVGGSMPFENAIYGVFYCVALPCVTLPCLDLPCLALPCLLLLSL